MKEMIFDDGGAAKDLLGHATVRQTMLRNNITNQ
jgi:hypothetical protein